MREIMTDTENFLLDYKNIITGIQKKLLLCVVFAIDYDHFEN